MNLATTATSGYELQVRRSPPHTPSFAEGNPEIDQAHARDTASKVGAAPEIVQIRREVKEIVVIPENGPGQ